ncbi:hypothetical protein AN960_23290 [Bacillus sp. FJAT-25509]|nr:hypothetical protein AN960_23290 [Bacillus sp. FJAT-25509]
MRLWNFILMGLLFRYSLFKKKCLKQLKHCVSLTMMDYLGSFFYWTNFIILIMAFLLIFSPIKTGAVTVENNPLV